MGNNKWIVCNNFFFICINEGHYYYGVKYILLYNIFHIICICLQIVLWITKIKKMSFINFLNFNNFLIIKRANRPVKVDNPATLQHRWYTLEYDIRVCWRSLETCRGSRKFNSLSILLSRCTSWDGLYGFWKIWKWKKLYQVKENIFTLEQTFVNHW